MRIKAIYAHYSTEDAGFRQDHIDSFKKANPTDGITLFNQGIFTEGTVARRARFSRQRINFQAAGLPVNQLSHSNSETLI
jgi:hypothetical protein